MAQGDVLQARVESTLASLHPGFAAKAKAFLSMGLPWATLDRVQASVPVWRPEPLALIVLGDLEVDGNVVVRTSASEDTFLVVLGSIRCRNLVVSRAASLVCAGDVLAREAIVCTAADSVSVAAGKVDARLLASGRGAWLQIYEESQLAVTYLSGYVMVGREARRRVPPPPLDSLAVGAALDTREWDSLSPEDREGETRSDYIRLDGDAAERLIAGGQSILVTRGS